MKGTLQYILVFYRLDTKSCSPIAVRLWNELVLHSVSYCKLFLFQFDLGLFLKKLEMGNVKPKSITFTSDLCARLSLARQTLPLFFSDVPKLLSPQN